MKKIITLLLFIVTLIACKNDPKPEKVEEQEEKSNKMPPPQDGGKGAEIMNTVIDLKQLPSNLNLEMPFIKVPVTAECLS